MAVWPTTDPSLIRRLGDFRNDDAWLRFDALYRPVIYRFVRRCGAEHQDADEVVADVMRRVARAATRWNSQRPPDQFAAWLTQITKNSLLNLVCRELSKRGRGGTTHQASLGQRPAATEQSQHAWAQDRQREWVRLAAARIQNEYSPDNWQAFWQTHVDGVSIEDVARRMGKTCGSIYAVRSRIIRRLRLEVAKLQAEEASR